MKTGKERKKNWFVCQNCKSSTRMMVHVTLSAPSSMYGNLTKKNLRKKEVYLMSANWECTDFLCSKCSHVVLGYGNYVTNLKKENDLLRTRIEILERVR